MAEGRCEHESADGSMCCALDCHMADVPRKEEDRETWQQVVGYLLAGEGSDVPLPERVAQICERLGRRDPLATATGRASASHKGYREYVDEIAASMVEELYRTQGYVPGGWFVEDPEELIRRAIDEVEVVDLILLTDGKAPEETLRERAARACVFVMMAMQSEIAGRREVAARAEGPSEELLLAEVGEAESGGEDAA